MLARATAHLKNPRVYASIILGTSFGIVLYSYWLTDLLPPTSKQILLYAVLLGLTATILYFMVLERQVQPLLNQLGKGSRWGLIIGSALIGTYLSFAYLNAPGDSPRYVTFLLPKQSLSIVASATSQVPDVAIIGFTTSLGDVSYNALKAQGWTRDGYRLRLSDPSKNSLEWSGRTGGEAVITIESHSPGDAMNVTWNGDDERLSLASNSGASYQYSHKFHVPFYASIWMLLILGSLNFIVICLVANLLIWKKRAVILSGLQGSVSGLLYSSRNVTTNSGGDSEVGWRIPHREWIVIIGLTGLAALLRVFNLGNLYPYADEYSHLLAARDLLQGAPLFSVFNRSLLTVTVPVFISQRLFGIHLWSARLPGTIFNAAAIVPLYFLTRKINRPVAVLSGLLYASSPMIIAVSRNVREYAYYPALFYLIVYAMILFLERLPDKLIIFRDWKKPFARETRLLTLALLLPLIYAIFVDARSTFKIIMVAYGVLGLFLIKKFDLRSKVNLSILVILGLGAVLSGFLYAQAFGFHNLSVTPRFHAESLWLFFPNPIQQWYFDRPTVIPAVALLIAVAICFRSIRSNLVPSFLVALLLASAVFFTTFFGHYFMPRYLTSMELWYVVVLALGLYGIFALQLALPRKDAILPLVGTTLFALTFNFIPTLMPTFYDKQGNMPITGEYHYNVGPAYAFLLDKVSDKDVLISNFYAGYIRWKGQPSFQKVYSYGFYEAKLQYKWIFPYEAAETFPIDLGAYIRSIVGENNSGWLVLDSVTYFSKLSKPLPLKTTAVGNKRLEYIGYFGGEYIWRWQADQPPP